jgi:hypothetical protein
MDVRPGCLALTASSAVADLAWWVLARLLLRVVPGCRGGGPGWWSSSSRRARRWLCRRRTWPQHLVSSVASDHRARGAGVLRAGWCWWSGWPLRGGCVWLATHRRAKACLGGPSGPMSVTPLGATSFLKLSSRWCFSPLCPGSPGETPDPTRGRASSVFLRRLPLLASPWMFLRPEGPVE